MVPTLRKAFNDNFTDDQYQEFLQALDAAHPGAIQFRIAETPVFVPAAFIAKMLDACEHIIDIINDPRFRELTERSIPATEKVPNDNGHAHMIAFDFGVCTDEEGNLEPQLIEMQGFPTLFGFQVLYPELVREHFPVPEKYSHYLGGYNKETYIQALREVILGPHSPENVILLEIKPHEQKTRIDFYCTTDYVGIQPVCLTELIQEGRQLYYTNNGVKTQVKRIYNRVIFDDLNAQEASLLKFTDITKDLDVEWIPHPNWFYRVSKFTLPLIRHPYVPPTFYLDEIKQLPSDLENFVLKPLFSFAGQGVIIDLTKEDVENVKDPENWILQRKVKYAEVIPTPDVPAKVEIRIMYLWKDKASRPEPVINLARISKGKMIGVRYNMDKTWVGGSVCFFERK